MKRLFQNREFTWKSISDDIDYLKEKLPGFAEWRAELQFNLAMRFFQCRRGRLQKAKMVVDVVTRLTPLILALATLLLAIKAQ